MSKKRLILSVHDPASIFYPVDMYVNFSGYILLHLEEVRHFIWNNDTMRLHCLLIFTTWRLAHGVDIYSRYFVVAYLANLANLANNNPHISSSLIDIKVLNLRYLLASILTLTPINRCFVVITDNHYESLYNHQFFRFPREPTAYLFLKVTTNNEDLLSPNYQTVRVLKQIKHFNCDIHFITLSDGEQV